MAQPTISEIIQAGSPTQSTEPLGTAFDISQGAQQVFQAAQLQQQADWQRYSKFTENLQNFMADAKKVSELEIAPEDKQVVMGKLADFLKKAEGNLGAIANPMADPAAFAQLNKEGADVYALGVKSKQRNAYDLATKSFMQQNPEFATPENRQILESSFKTPLEAWQPYQLDKPMPAFDINKLAADANAFSENPNFMEVIGEVGGKDPATGKYTKGNEWIASREGTVYDEPKFTDKWGSYYNYADKNGINTIKDWTKTFVYDQLGDADKKRLGATGDPLKAAWMEYGKNLRAKDKLGEKLTKSSEWETKYEQSNQNKRAAMSARGSGTPTQGQSGSLWAYANKVIAPNESVRFDQVDSYLKNELQGTYEYDETLTTGYGANEKTTTIKKRIPDDAYVSIQGDNIVVSDSKGKVYINTNKNGLDAKHSERVTKGLSGALDYNTYTPVTGQGGGGGAYIPKTNPNTKTTSSGLPIIK